MAIKKKKPKYRKPGPKFTRETAEVRRRMLVEAALRCLSRGGISAFTTDNIRREANVSLGLINHHFKSKDDLIVEVYYVSLYEYIYKQVEEARKLQAQQAGAVAEARLIAIVDAHFAPSYFAKDNLLVWLSLWGEMATNAKLSETHKNLYKDFRQILCHEIKSVAEKRRRTVNASNLARSFIALVDGLWLEWCLDPSILTPEDAREACYELLEAKLGSLRA